MSSDRAGPSYASFSPLNLPSSSTRAAGTASDQRDVSMLFIGARCHHSECLREDFLPLKCPHCANNFCGLHWKAADGNKLNDDGSHHCSYDVKPPTESFFAPSCPLCNKVPDGWRRGESVESSVTRHIETEACPVLAEADGGTSIRKSSKERKRKEGRCSHRRCEKTMVVKMECERCREAFCPSHRSPAQHNCEAARRDGCSPAPRDDAKGKTSSFASITAPFERLKVSQQSSSADPIESSSDKGDTRAKEQGNSDDGKGNDLNVSTMIARGLQNISADRKLDKWVPPSFFAAVAA